MDTDQTAALEAERLAETIKRIVDGAPPLTGEQRAKLALLLQHEA